MIASIALVSRLTTLAISTIVAVAVSLTFGIPAAHAFGLSQSPDDTWMTNPTNGRVYATILSEDGETLYIGGKFTTVRENPPGEEGDSFRVDGLAAIDVATGSAISGWDPRVTGGEAVVRALEVKGDRVFVGGNFTDIGGQPRQNLAAVRTVDAPVGPGTVDSFAPVVAQKDTSANPPYVYALLANDSKLYVGGMFLRVNGVSRSKLAAFNLATGTLDPTFKPTANNKVLDLEFDQAGTSIFASGSFKTVKGSDRTFAERQSVSRFDAATGNLHPWEIPSGTITGPQNG